MSHTPGPWINDASHPEWERNVIWANDVVVAHVVDDQHGNADANARLIAAAPELLSELKRMLSLWEEAIGYEKDYMDMGDPARAAIAKAEGGE